MKKLLIVIIILGLFSGWSFSQLSFRFYGGLTHVMSSDISSAAKATNELFDLYGPSHTGYFEKLCCGTNFGGELIYSISDKMGVGIGIEFIRLKNESNLSYDFDIPVDQTTGYTIKALPIMLNLHYSFPITPLLHAFVSAGTGYYFLNMDYNADILLDYGALGTGDQSYTFQSSQGTFGIQARWGIEVIVSESISFLVGGIGRYVKYSDIKGDWTDKETIPTIFNYNESGSDHYFWYYEESIEGKNYPQVGFGKIAPSDVASSRKGKIDLSGLSFTAGIKIGLDFKKK
ncbi:outer membrane beta-barrel protein [Acidobacteriota bacterium]